MNKVKLNKPLKLLLPLMMGTALVGCGQKPATSQQAAPAGVIAMETTTSVTAEGNVTTNMADEAESMQFVTGTIGYRERIAIPDTAVITVTLEDVSIADAPATIIDTQTFSPEGKQVPYNFELKYNQADIKARHRYSVRGNIKVDGELRFTSNTMLPVITDADKTQKVNVMLVGVKK